MKVPQALPDKALAWQQALPKLQKLAKPPVQLGPDQHLLWIDLSAGNTFLAQLDVADTAATDAYIQQELKQKNAAGAIGGYLENRLLYLRSNVFAADEHRTLHIGMDIWLPAGVPLFAVLPGSVHSYADNDNFGDYGPTIILEHQLEDIQFYTLYGHLSRTSLASLYEGKTFAAGEPIATLGTEAENGNWPPHLHFQIILDMQGRRGDFPGVAAPSQKEYYQQLCPNPNDLLKFRTEDH
ncbi:peptidase m23 [Flammeovirgaceae bacterium 311]|nr:peptidase m23 [Flammeovirgaceae bacterium 311]